MRSLKLPTNKKTSRVLTLWMTAFFIIAGVLFGCGFLPVQVRAQEEESKVVRVGWYDSTYCYKDAFGRRTGMAYEYQQKLVAYTGWTYEYVEGTWPELLQMLIDGEIDMLSDVSYTKERSESILYPSVPMGMETYYIFIKAGNTEMTLEDINTFDGKVFGVDKGSVMEKLTLQWAAENGIEIEIREISEESVDESIELLENGEIDAFVTVDSYGDRESCVPVCQVGTSEYYFAVNKDRPDLLRELNAALTSVQNVDPYYNQRLLQKYIWSVNTNVYLTDRESAWLKEHGAIRVGYRDNYMPFCADSDGQLIGALSDFFDEASRLPENAELIFEPVPYANTDDSLKALANGEVDVVFPINLGPYEMENMGLIGTEILMYSEIYAVVKPGNPKDLFNDEGVKVMLLEGNVNFDIFVKDFFPQWTIDHRPTLDECYRAVSTGEADCAMVNSYRINKNDRLRRRYKLSLLATGEDMDFSLGIKKENIELYGILNKVVKITSNSETEKNLSRYAGGSEKVTFLDYLYDNAAAFLAITVIIASIILFLLLTKLHSDKQASERQKLIAATELDPLTKLYSRNYFFEYAARLHKEKPENHMDAIVLNIEQFHAINAIYGWDFGDRILLALGDEIRAYIKENDGIACRSTADRFDIYSKHTDDYQAVFDRLQHVFEGFTENVNIRIRMGVMPYQPDLNPVELFDRARTACNMVRGKHHIRLMVFNEDMRQRELLEQRLLNDLKYAVDHREFIVFYQPKYDIQGETPVLRSAEALVRWKHHELGMIPPGEFIGLFEKHAQIGTIDKYVWEEAARQIKVWKEKYGKVIPISVNLSRIDIFGPDLVKTIEEIIEKNGISREDLHLEVTESAYTEDTEQVIGVVKSLRDLGYVIEMDDFGTGYSSLNMLSSMPVDILKLDKSFIDNIEKTGGKEEKDIRLVELILDIAKSLKLVVVAEGVESEKQIVFLKDRGCDMVQGYYFSPPVPAEKFEDMAFPS